MPSPFQTVGTRVRLRRSVDRYPHFTAPAGALGTVTYVDDEHAGCLVEVTLDEPVAGAEAWENAVQWLAEDDDPAGDLEVIADGHDEADPGACECRWYVANVVVGDDDPALPHVSTADVTEAFALKDGRGAIYHVRATSEDDAASRLAAVLPPYATIDDLGVETIR